MDAYPPTSDDVDPDVLPADEAEPLTIPANNVPEATAARPLTRPTVVWIFPVVLLFGAWLILAFSSGGYVQSQWLLPGLALAFFALVVSVMRVYPLRPRRLSMILIVLLALYAVWVMLSALWAASLNSVWDEAGRTLLYLLAFTLALTFFTDARARQAARYLLLTGACALVAFTVYRIYIAGATDGGLEQLFWNKRFIYPVSYMNGAAALYLLLFWPLLWMAADPRERVPIRGISLATCWGLLALAILTQSRGGFLATVLTLIFLFILSPARLRTLVFLLVPAGLAVWGFPDLNSYWRLGPGQVGGGVAVRVILLGMAVAAAVAITLALLERWVDISRRMRLVFGAVVLVALAASAVYGAALFERQVGDPGRWLNDSWSRFASGQLTTIPGAGSTNSQDENAAASRFLTVSTNGRTDLWRVAWRDFRGSPWLGVGAGNYVYTYDRQRSLTLVVRQPHSWELRTLSETGAVGGILLIGALVLGFGTMLWPRVRAGWDSLRRGPQAGRWGADPRLYTWETMLAIGVLYWMIHGSGEWLWHLPGVSLPAVFMLALGVASVDAGAGSERPPMLGWMNPEHLNRWFQRGLIGAATLTLVVLALPYLSLRVQDSALGMTGTDDHAALRSARFAARLQPLDPQPLLTEADIYRLAAARASSDGALDDLALSLDAHIRAVERDPTSWNIHYQAGMAALRLLEASRGYPLGGLGDTTSTDVGQGDRPSLVTPETEAQAQGFLQLTTGELRLLARSYLLQAQERNPLNRQVQEALAATDEE